MFDETYVIFAEGIHLYCKLRVGNLATETSVAQLQLAAEDVSHVWPTSIQRAA